MRPAQRKRIFFSLLLLLWTAAVLPAAPHLPAGRAAVPDDTLRTATDSLPASAADTLVRPDSLPADTVAIRPDSTARNAVPADSARRKGGSPLADRVTGSQQD
ncbi:hypothetical protein, partial [Rikenella microfusus]